MFFGIIYNTDIIREKRSIMENKPNDNGNNNQEKQTIFTKETLGVVLMLFATLCLVCLITRGSVFSVPGEAVNTFFFGCFGYFAFVIVGATFYYGLTCITGKSIAISKKLKAYLILSLVLLDFLVHVISMHSFSGNYGQYIVTSYKMAQENGIATCSGGGFFTAILAYIFPAILKNVGSYVVLSILLVISGFMVYKTVMEEKTGKPIFTKKYLRTSFVKSENAKAPDAGVNIEGVKDYPVNVDIPVETQGVQKLFVLDAHKDDFRQKPKTKDGVDLSVKVDYTKGGLGVASRPSSYAKEYSNDMQSKIDYIKTPAPLNLDKNTYYQAGDTTTKISDYIKTPDKQEQAKIIEQATQNVIEEKPIEVESIPFFEHQEEALGNDAKSHAVRFSNLADFDESELGDISSETTEIVRPMPKDQEIDQFSNEQEIDDQFNIDFIEEENDQAIQEEPSSNSFESIVEPIFEEKEDKPLEQEITDSKPTTVSRSRVRNIFLSTEEDKSLAPKEEIDEKPAFTSRVEADNNVRSRRMGFETSKQQEEVQEEKPKKEIPINREYFRPPLDLLCKYEPSLDAPTEDHEQNKEIIKQTLADFHINVEPQDYVQGPSITRYEITMPAGTSVRNVLKYDDDLRMRLASKAGVRIQAPIPGKNLVGIEVANKQPQTVGLREVMEKSAEDAKFKPGSLMFAVGKDIVGKAIMENLAKGPHYLVAGATGSGKSVCLNTMIVSLIMRYSPEELKLFLVDPKGVEFATYEHLPHLMIDEIITSPQKAIEMLKWAYDEMQRRFQTFRESEAFVVDIDGYNSQVASATVAKMPRIVIIIDELADLMQTCKRDLEGRICAIAQKARSAGIHLVLATQRPSVDVITGTIKANLASRIAFKVMNFADSQTILSEAGAEKLLGNGDMLYKNAQMPGVERCQGAFISPAEVNSIVSYIKEHNVAYFDDELKEFLEKAANPQPETPVTSDGGETGENSDIFVKALWFAVNAGTISISSMQRRFGIGFSKAGGIMDRMDRSGYVGPIEGSKPRKVLLSREDFIEKYGEAPQDEF